MTTMKNIIVVIVAVVLLLLITAVHTSAKNLGTRQEVLIGYITEASSPSRENIPVVIKAAQVVQHTVEFEDFGIIEGVQADLLTLDVESEILETKIIDPTTGRETARRQPGRIVVQDFYIYCKSACPEVLNWAVNTVTGGIPPLRQTVTVKIPGNTPMQWTGYNCWASQYTTTPSQDLPTVYPRFKITCEALDLTTL
jgi:hypothetical protein